jgi:hypothetical protein
VSAFPTRSLVMLWLLVWSTKFINHTSGCVCDGVSWEHRHVREQLREKELPWKRAASPNRLRAQMGKWKKRKTASALFFLRGNVYCCAIAQPL